MGGVGSLPVGDEPVLDVVHLRRVPVVTERRFVAHQHHDGNLLATGLVDEPDVGDAYDGRGIGIGCVIGRRRSSQREGPQPGDDDRVTRIAGRLAFDVVTVPLERIEQRRDLPGHLELVLVAAKRLELGGEVGVVFDPGHTCEYGV